MTPFTLVMAYYDNPQMLEEQCKQLHALPPLLRAHLHLIVVDDGSPRWPAAEILRPRLMRWSLESVQLWRMDVDVSWNQDACRNLGVREAPTRWVLLTDMDHVVPVETWMRLMTEKLDKRAAYRFGRVSAPVLTPYKPHPNSWAMTQKTYWRAGGYDERLAGNYGTDGDVLVRLRRAAEVVDLPEALIRYPREVIADASTTTLVRKSQADKVRISNLIQARKANPNWQPLHFSFPCRRVL